jgi:hypothetical protein
MSPQARVGLVMTVLGFVGGVWLFLAPFIVGYQEVGQDWIDATRNDLWAGGALMAVSALTFFLFAAFALRDAVIRADERRRAEEEDTQSRGSEPASGPSGSTTGPEPGQPYQGSASPKGRTSP